MLQAGESMGPRGEATPEAATLDIPQVKLKFRTGGTAGFPAFRRDRRSEVRSCVSRGNIMLIRLLVVLHLLGGVASGPVTVGDSGALSAALKSDAKVLVLEGTLASQ